MSRAWTVPGIGHLDPPELDGQSYWMVDALAAEEPHPGGGALTSTLRADVCIVGGGFTGLWTAIELKQRDPSLDVVLLEAGVCGSGASGANAGILMNLWPKLPALMQAGGETEALDVARASVEVIDYVERFCKEHDIEAGLERNGWLWASTNSSQDGAWNTTLAAALSHSGSPFIEVDMDTATRIAGAPVRSGVLDPSCAGVHPGRLVRGLLRAARSLGVTVHEHSPMTGLDSEHGATVVRSTHGSVRADSVVLAINAWCNQFPALRRHLLMTASDNVVVRPGSPSHTPPVTTNVSDSGRLLDYWRPLEHDKVLFGKAGLGLGWGVRGASTQFRTAPRRASLMNHMTRSVPALAGAEVISTWRAPVEYSLSSLPFFGELPDHPGVYFGTGYSGDGVGPSVLGARILASLSTGADDGLASSFLTRPPAGRGLPPEPFRFLGGQLVKAAMLRQERKQDEEKRVDVMTNVLTRIDPTSFAG
ncbi:NAD(P)/FAD-dependent oxidoreductase [Leekyejoonella antrihumi]|uniref:FAD-dependent oxidoreductase n=1 Tax=Leekyejoonella antrihumi TaxID=1660198 RepID=A0A563E2D9_9MICO|nr:FAD-dependent oxidoreductase [Leekyejoonella antrihumi]TWP36403.1 FAD-dependent oxidoreductase [Leekyejoonella antrihumi]